MKIRMSVKVDLNRAAIKRRIEEARDPLVERVAKSAAKHARYFAPYDTGLLESTIEAEPVGPGEWWLWARTEYALIQELRQPYLYSGAIHAMQEIPKIWREVW